MLLNLQCTGQLLQQRMIQPKGSAVPLSAHPVLGVPSEDEDMKRKNGFRDPREQMRRFRALENF